MNGTCKAFRKGQAEGNYRVLHEVEQGTQLTARFWDNVEDSSTSYGRRKETVMKEEKKRSVLPGVSRSRDMRFETTDLQTNKKKGLFA